VTPSEFAAAFGTDDACRAHLERVRRPDGPACPRCGAVEEAVAVSTRPGLHRCRPCGKQFTVTVGTPLEGSHLPLRHWYLAMSLMLNTAKPISAMSLSRHLGVQYRTCWHLLHRLRAMLASGEGLPLAGVIEADETCVGGKARDLRKHRDRPTRGRGTAKPMLFAAIERGGGAGTAVVPPAGAAALDPLVFGRSGRGGLLRTDELGAYGRFGRKMRLHYRVNHPAGEHARAQDGAGVHVNTAEGLFGLFERAILGIHHHVSPKHPHRHVAEHTFRYDGRRNDTAQRIARCLIGRHGRLRLRELFARRPSSGPRPAGSVRPRPRPARWRGSAASAARSGTTGPRPTPSATRPRASSPSTPG
jgi:transposase-like protein